MNKVSVTSDRVWSWCTLQTDVKQIQRRSSYKSKVESWNSNLKCSDLWDGWVWPARVTRPPPPSPGKFKHTFKFTVKLTIKASEPPKKDLSEPHPPPGPNIKITLTPFPWKKYYALVSSMIEVCSKRNLISYWEGGGGLTSLQKQFSAYMNFILILYIFEEKLHNFFSSFNFLWIVNSFR